MLLKRITTLLLSATTVCLALSIAYGDGRESGGPIKVGGNEQKEPAVEDGLDVPDANGDGKVTSAELKNYLKALQQKYITQQLQKPAIVEKFDKDKSKTLEEAEMKDAIQAVAKMFEKNYEHLIKAKANLNDEENEFDHKYGNKDCILDGKELKNFEKHKQEKKKQLEEDREAQRVAEEQRKEEQKRQLLERFDKDGDGKLNATEMAAAQRALDLEAQERAILAKYDKNSDGTLDDAERALAEEELRGLVNAADINRDGVVSDLELFKSIRELRGRMDEKLKDELQKRFPNKTDFDKELQRIEENRNARFKKMRAMMLKKFDENNNGDIDGDERSAVIEYLKHHKHLGPAFSDLETGEE